MAAIDVGYLQLVTRHQPAIYGYIRSLAPGADIEDILQETNLVLWEKSAVFQPGSNFKAFAFRIAHLKTLEALRAERRRHWLVFDTDLLESIAERQMESDVLADGQQAALRHCLLTLSAEEHQLIRSRYTHRKTVRDIARETGRSEGALQQLYFRLRNALRSCIEQRLAREGGAA
jgi:RNA polymerase sigma-70 factor (ECF subfamily)